MSTHNEGNGMEATHLLIGIPESIPRKYPEDFKEWRILGLILQNRYLVLEAPNGRMQALIHREDNHVAYVLDAVTGLDLWHHPVNLNGARIFLEVSVTMSKFLEEIS